MAKKTKPTNVTSIKRKSGWGAKMRAAVAKIQAETPAPPPPPERPPLREATREEVNKELRRIAYFDPRWLFDNDGKPLPIQDLDDDTAAVICGLEAIEEYDWDRATPEQKRKIVTGMMKKYNMSSKIAALGLLDTIVERGTGENARNGLRDLVNALKDPDGRR